MHVCTRPLCVSTCACLSVCMQVTNVLVLDENPEGLEGPWVTYARMMTLRTSKSLTGQPAAEGGETCFAF